MEILESQEKVSKYWYGWGNYEVHQKVRYNGDDIHMKVWFRIMMVNVMMWFLQTRSRWRKMQENWSTYICSILTSCKPSHNLVSMAHKNEKLILIFSQMVASMIWASVWPMWILSKIKISCFHVAKISKNWTMKKSGKSQKISLLVTRGNPDPP